MSFLNNLQELQNGHRQTQGLFQVASHTVFPSHISVRVISQSPLSLEAPYQP